MIPAACTRYDARRRRDGPTRERSCWVRSLNEAVFGDGEALLSTGSQASKTAFSDTRFISFRVPFKPIAALVPNVEDYLCRRIRRDVEALRLLAGYGEILMNDAQACPAPGMQRLVTTHVYDLVAPRSGAARGMEPDRQRGRNAAPLSRSRDPNRQSSDRNATHVPPNR
jgi:hypothetical protein